MCVCSLSLGDRSSLTLTYTQFLVYMDRDSWVRAQIQLIPSSIKSFDHILSHVCECHHFHLMDAIIVFDILSCTSKFVDFIDHPIRGKSFIEFLIDHPIRVDSFDR